MNPGELYTTPPGYFLLVYPSQEKAFKASLEVERYDRAAAAATIALFIDSLIAYWSKELQCQVRWVEPESKFMMLSSSSSKRIEPVHVLFGDFDGWIIKASWLKFHKLTP